MHSRVHDTASGDAWQGRHLSSSSRVAGRSGTAQSRVRACGGCRTTSGSRWSGARSLLGPSHERILHRTPRVRMPDARTGRWDHRCRGSSHGLTVDIPGLRTGVERARWTPGSTASCGSSHGVVPVRMCSVSRRSTDAWGRDLGSENAELPSQTCDLQREAARSDSQAVGHLGVGSFSYGDPPPNFAGQDA